MDTLAAETGPPAPPAEERAVPTGRPFPSKPRSGKTWTVGVGAALVVAGLLIGVHYVAPAPTPASANDRIQVVAAENFWGSLVAQVGGTRVSVVSIVSDPNADPHTYESNTSAALALSNAQLVVQNGAGYDDWCTHILAASNTPGQVVLNVGNLLRLAAGNNPHFWYGQSYVVATIAAMYSDLVTIDPGSTSYYQRQYAALNASLAPVWAEEASIRAHFAGTPVASTETIFVDMANSTGVDVISPFDFMKAVAEGNDPPVASVIQFQNQLTSGAVRVLVYNLQTLTPLTQSMQTLAAQNNVSLVGVTETIQPPNVTFQVWQLTELLTLSNALAQKAPGR